MAPTFVPSLSLFPTLSPPPSAHPSSSPSTRPTLQPSLSSIPTVSPEPSSQPSSTPSAMPSLNVTIIAKRYYVQTFQADKEFEQVELSIFKKFMESFTNRFEYGATEHIMTNCTVVSQSFNDTTRILSINYSLNYTTNYMSFERISEYPDMLFASQNMTILTKELIERDFSPTLVALELVMLDEGEVITLAPILPPSSSPTFTSTLSLTRMETDSSMNDNGASLLLVEYEEYESNIDESLSANAISATNVPDHMELSIEFSSSTAPSPPPPIHSLVPNNDKKPGKSDLGVGLGVGIFVASLVCVGGLITWVRFQNKDQTFTHTSIEASAGPAIDEASQDFPSILLTNSEGEESVKSLSIEEFHGSQHNVDIEAAKIDSDQAAKANEDDSMEQDNLVIPMMMKNLDDSDTSNDFLGQSFNEGGDIFDTYKNNQLEEFREGVTSVVRNADEMMNLALTQSLKCENTAEKILNGVENPSEVEASLIYETYEFMSNQEESTIGANEFFQKILNGMVVIVRVGILHPVDAARIVSHCAAMLGLEMLKDFPDNMILVTAMRKSNDTYQGQTDLVDAFKVFGPIEGVAFCKCFGVVRFVHSSSVERSFRTSKIEVQGVSVMIQKLR